MQVRNAAGRGWQGLSEPAILSIGLGALLAFRLLALHLNRTDLFFDEAQYWSWSVEPAFGYYSKPPLIAWIIRAATSICGDSTACIRAPAPLLHTATAAVIYMVGSRLHDRVVGLWSALAFATLPGVSLSSGIISTDVPLLLCWAVALWGYVALRDGGGWPAAIPLGVAAGAGLNAKYAMVFFAVCVAIHMVVTPSARRMLSDVKLWSAAAIGVLLIVPNLAWNIGNGFATFAHTADNAKWGGPLLNIGKGLEFFGAQAGVFGPILFAGLIVVVYRGWRDGLPDQDRLLLAFTLPVLLLITAQAFRSRAHANWAAVSYVAGVILVTATFLRWGGRRWLLGSLAAHGTITAMLVGGTALAGTFSLPGVGDPFQRTLGWKGMAEAAQAELARARAEGAPFKAVMTDDRSLTAELLYYLRHDPTPVVAWREGSHPLDHYEMTRPFQGNPQSPVLLLSIRREGGSIPTQFGVVKNLGTKKIPAGLGEPRAIQFFALSEFKGAALTRQGR